MGTASHLLFEHLGTISKPVNSKESDLSVSYEATMVELDLLALLEQEGHYYPLLRVSEKMLKWEECNPYC